MFEKRSNEQEIMDNLQLDDAELNRNLTELDRYNRLLGGTNVLLNALNTIYHKNNNYITHHKITIADLGCGSGELVKAIAAWAQENKINVELNGFDANKNIIEYANTQTTPNQQISYKVMDIFSEEFKRLSFDIITINSVTHHFSDAALVTLLKQLKQQTRLAIIINDLQRHWFSYFFTKIITKLFSFSYLAKHDAPLSVLRAFKKQEWIALLHQANIQSYRIRWAWAFRWEVIISLM